MRATIAVCLAAALLLAAYLSLSTSGSIDAPPPYEESPAPPRNSGIETQPVAQAETERKASSKPAEAEGKSPRPTLSPTPTTAPVEAPVEPPTTIRIVVRDIVTQAAVDSFRWRFQQASMALRGESSSSTLALSLPNLAVGNLLIEADGMQPFTQKELRIPAAGAPAETLNVYLTPVATAAGITLMVKTLDNQPVVDVRVDAYELSALKRKENWQLGRPIWARRTTSTDGIYALPPLPPGEYGILLVATSSQGDLLPVAPFRHVFDLNGSNGFLEDVSLAPACALRLELSNSSGQPFDPKLHGEVAIRLNPVGEAGIKRKWTASEESGNPTAALRTVSEADRVPGKGLIWLDEPVAPGTYLLEIFIDGNQRVHQQLQLRQGEQQIERVTIF